MPSPNDQVQVEGAPGKYVPEETTTNRQNDLTENHTGDNPARTDADEKAAEENGAPSPEQRAEARRKNFEARQESERKTFERNFKADEARTKREEELSAARAKKQDEINARRAKRQDLAMEHGYLSDADLEQRRNLLAPHHDFMEPHQALTGDEETVLMAFPRDVMLTLSAGDFRRINGIKENPDDETVGQGAVMQGSRVLFRKGYEDVPVSLADHPYLYANGAFRVSDDGKPETDEERSNRLRKDAPRENPERDEPPVQEAAKAQ